VSFSILPALDVSHGRLALAAAGGPPPVDPFGGEPDAAAHALVEAGARALHVVDLDLALEGAAGLDVGAIRAVAPASLLQVSGGIVSAATGRRYLEAGADRFVLSSSALTDEAATVATLHDAGPAVVVGIEVEEGAIRGRAGGRSGSGGRSGARLDLMSTLGWLHAAGAPTFLVTATRRVGELAGPDVELVRRVARTGRPTLAAGGVRSLDDLRAIRDAGAVGAVVGRAALEGSFDLDAALAWAET